MSKLKPIAADTYDFPTLIEEGCVYVDKTAPLSARTLDRKLATLIARKMIEFRGAPKTGGYYAKGVGNDV